MNETARLVALDDMGAWVDADRRGVCGNCSARSGCGTTLLNALHPRHKDYLHVLVDHELRGRLRVGDTVEISMSDELVVQASAIMYLLPLGLLLAGAIAGSTLVTGDAGTAAGSILGLALGAGLARLLARGTNANTTLRPRLVRRLAPLAAAPLEMEPPGAIS